MSLAVPLGALSLLLSFMLLGASSAYPPAPTHYVTDTANALSTDTRDELDAELKNYEKRTGHQVIVWIGETTGDVPLETWTVEAAHAWRIGRKGHDDGAVLFLFMRDRKVRIEVGYGLESELTDADSKRIIDDDIVPAMRAGETDRAVTHGVIAILSTITPSYRPSVVPSPQPEPPERDNSLPVWVVIVFFALPWGLALIFMIWRGVFRKGAWSGTISSGGINSSSDFGSSSSDDDFDSGGGDFGGGGASGGW